MSQPLVTIIITVFNRTEYLAEAIKSAIDQSLQNLEIIVTDDSNSKSIQEICSKFASDNRVRYRANPSVLGAPLNIRAALEEASGEYVVILNDDDIMEPFMIDTLLAPLLKDSKGVVSFADHWIINANGEVLDHETDRNTRFWGRDRICAGKIADTLALTVRGGVPFVMGTIFRRVSCLGRWFVRDVEGAYDSWLALQLALSGGGFYFNPTRVLRYRVHDASESARLAADKAKAQVFIFSALVNDPRAYRELGYIRRTLAHFLFVLGRDRLYFGKRSAARESFVRSLKYAISIRSLLGLALTWVPTSIQRRILRSWRTTRGIDAELPAAG